MPRRSTRPPLVLLPQEVDLLERLRKSHAAPRRAVQRAQVLWLYHTDESIAAIMSAVHLTRKSVAKWVGAALVVTTTSANGMVSTETRTLSADGKTMTVVRESTGQNGPTKRTTVYDKQ